MTVKYSNSWSFLGGNPNKRHSTVRVETENGKTKSITVVKSFATENEAKRHAAKLNTK